MNKKVSPFYFLLGAHGLPLGCKMMPAGLKNGDSGVSLGAQRVPNVPQGSLKTSQGLPLVTFSAPCGPKGGGEIPKVVSPLLQSWKLVPATGHPAKKSRPPRLPGRLQKSSKICPTISKMSQEILKKFSKNHQKVKFSISPFPLVNKIFQERHALSRTL